MTTDPVARGRRSRRAGSRLALVVVLTAGVLLGVTALAAVAAPARAGQPPGPSPVVPTPPSTVRATALPTAQVDGIVWSQAVAGGTVFAGGEFASARPAGVAVGGRGQVGRRNLLAYDLATGVLDPNFRPAVNGAVQTVVASADGRTVWIGGAFTRVEGQPRYRLAGFDVRTGELLPDFHPTFDTVVDTLVQYGNTLYVGGAFSRVDGRPRAKLAALNATTGALLGWRPSADYIVHALAVSADGTSVVVAGGFATLNGVSARGLGALDRRTGATKSFPVNQAYYSYGDKAAFLSLSTSGTAVYASAYNFGGAGNLEGMVAADSDTGSLLWLDDCHGDTYDTYATPSTVYSVGHTHYCGNNGGFPEIGSPRRALAFTTRVTGTVQHNAGNNGVDNSGAPSPSLMEWFPTLTPGQVTGSDQAAWTVTGSGPFLLMGGEFTAVNGVDQQGLVRFATAPTSPDTAGPKIAGQLTPNADSLGRGAVRMSFTTIWDQDDLTLTYTLQRVRGAEAPVTVWRYDADGTFWSSRTIAVADTDLDPGGTYRYRVVVTDAAGNTATGAWAPVTVPSSGAPPAGDPPVAALTARADGRRGLRLDGTGSTDPDGMVARWRWDFGDGTASNAPQVAHTYARPGRYTVTLTVTDDSGRTARAQVTRGVS